MKNKVLCPEPDSFSQRGLDYVREFTQLTAKKISQAEFEKIAPEFDAVLIRFNTKVGPNIFGKKSNIRAVISPTTGLDHIDMRSAKLNGVKVFHLRGEKRFLKGVAATAELSIGLMLSIMRKIPQSFSAVKSGIWETGPFRGNEVAGKTLGVIGCGRLGSKVSKTAVALGMKVVAFDPYIKRFPSGVKAMKTQRDLLNQADIVSLHVPLSDETRHLLNDFEISQMKKGVIIINTSRGAIIKTGALIKGLISEQVSAAALDVLEDEHLVNEDSHPLIEYASKYDNLIITPHLGGATFESVEKTDLFILKKYFKGI